MDMLIFSINISRVEFKEIRDFPMDMLIFSINISRVEFKDSLTTVEFLGALV